MDLEVNLRLTNTYWSLCFRAGHIFHTLHFMLHWVPKTWRWQWEPDSRILNVSLWLFNLMVILPKRVR